MTASRDSAPDQLMPVLIHLTEKIDTLASILREGRVRAINPFGAAHNHRELRESQLVACFSEIDLAGLTRLAKRHGSFGLGFHRLWVQSRGGAPVWYLPRNSPSQVRLFEIVKSLAFHTKPDLNHFLWEFTPFVDYPRDYGPTPDGAPYDWRWEREWRVRGDLAFKAEEVAILFAPEEVHEIAQGVWLREALDADSGTMPPVIDVRWPMTRQYEVLRSGKKLIVTELDNIGDPKSPDDFRVQPQGQHSEEIVNTAPDPREWVEDDELIRAEQREEWSAWLEVFEGDDI